MTSTTLQPTTDELRRAFAHYPSGVAAIAAAIDGHNEVLIASSFTVGVSVNPPLVMFAVQHTSTTWPVLAAAPHLGISVLAAAQSGICRQLASRDKSARWTDVAVTTAPSGAVTIDDASIYLEASVYGVHRAGDHDIVVFEVETVRPNHAADPLVFHGSQFRTLV